MQGRAPAKCALPNLLHPLTKDHGLQVNAIAECVGLDHPDGRMDRDASDIPGNILSSFPSPL